MKIFTIKGLKELFKERHTRRGYYDFVKTTLGILVSIIVLIIFLYDMLERFEFTTFDYRMKLRGKRTADERVVLVDMAEDSVKSIGRWPWPREWHATMISVLSQFGARAVVFDVIFSEPSSEFSDGAMEEAMRKSANVYIPYALELERYDEDKRSWVVRDLISPLERFSKWKKGSGHITIVPDSDGTIRKVPLIVDYQNRLYPQLGLKVACDILGLELTEYKVIETPLSRYMKIKNGGAIYIPVDKKDQMLVNWVARWGEDFKHYSYVDVITSYQRMLENKKPLVDLNEFKDKICIIGLTATGLYDVKSNPLQPTYPAVGTNANIISNILKRDFIKRAPRGLDAIIIIILGLILSLNVSKARPVRGAFMVAWMIVIYLLISYAALGMTNIWISVIYPMAAIIFGYLVITFYNQIVISVERAKLYTLATKDGLTGLFVIRHFNLLLEAEMNRVRARGGRLSILMSDIDHFKEINDTYGHQVGDFILKEVAGILISCCRQLDVPSRYGGEEFIAMLPGADINDAAMVAERIRKRMEGYNFRVGDKIYRATISLGVAMFKDEATRDDFVKKADEAL